MGNFILGLIVALDLISKVPQIYRLFVCKNSDSISILSYIFWNTSSVLYLIYCLDINAMTLFYETLLNLTLNTVILLMSMRYNKKNHNNYGVIYELRKMFK